MPPSNNSRFEYRLNLFSRFLIGGGAFDVSGGNHVTGILGRPFLSIRLSWFTMTKSGIPQWGIYRKKLELPVTWLVTDRIQTQPINKLQSPAKFTLKSIMIHIEIILAGNGHFALEVWILVVPKFICRQKTPKNFNLGAENFALFLMRENDSRTLRLENSQKSD